MFGDNLRKYKLSAVLITFLCACSIMSFQVADYLAPNTATSIQDGKVYICVSPNAYAYHNSYCRGLNQCTHDIDTISIAEAKDLGRRACGYCY